MPPLPLAHETWLREDQVPTDWDFVFEGATLALLAAAVLVTVAVRSPLHQALLRVIGRWRFPRQCHRLAPSSARICDTDPA